MRLIDGQQKCSVHTEVLTKSTKFMSVLIIGCSTDKAMQLGAHQNICAFGRRQF